LAAEDDRSGVAQTRYRLDSGSWEIYSGPFALSDDAIHSVDFYSTDNAGNVETIQTQTIKIDQTTPATTATLSGPPGDNGSYVGPVTVALAATDNLSGVALTEYRLDGGSWQTYAGSFTVVTDGLHSVDFYSTDIAGNVEATQSLTIDIEVPHSNLSGAVFEDFNNDGQIDFGENGIPGVSITLSGTDDLGNSVNLSQTTDADGVYIFLNLRPGSYTIAEAQPAGFTQGINTVGTGGGTVALDRFDVQLAAGLNALNYNYGERPAATGSVRAGQTAGIGFWNNKNGQALIRSLNGGAGTQLGDWLAATFPHMFGASSGTNNVAGKSNADVALFFQARFVVKGQKLDAQVLATALNVYVTDGTLDSTGVAAQYGFTVAGNGVATATFNVGANGAAFGVADNTVMTVMDLLLAADAQAVNGVLYNGNATRRDKANTVFSAINQAGSI
jgi:hypothetical protein